MFRVVVIPRPKRVTSQWGIALDTVETRTMKILSKLLFDNLQAQSRESARLNAEVAALESSRKINCGGRGDCPRGAGSPDAGNRPLARGRSTNRTLGNAMAILGNHEVNALRFHAIGSDVPIEALDCVQYPSDAPVTFLGTMR